MAHLSDDETVAEIGHTAPTVTDDTRYSIRHNIPMSCNQCGAALPGGQKFCGECGAPSNALSLNALNLRLAQLTTQVSELITVRKEAEQTFLEVDTAERVVKRVMSWAQMVGFFVGIPAALILAGLGIWAGKSLKDFHDVASTAQSAVTEKLDEARKDANAAERQAKDALDTAGTVNRNIEITQSKLKALGTTVTQSSDKVGQLDKGIDHQQARLESLTAATVEQRKALDNLSSKVQTLTKAGIEQDITRLHPEYGAHVVYGPKGGVLTAQNKPAGKLYVQIDLFNEDNFKPRLPLANITDGISKLQDHGFVPLFGQVALFATSGQTSMPIGSLGPMSCRGAHVGDTAGHGGVPCIVYFREELRGKALQVRDLLSGVQSISDDRVKLWPVSTLLPAQTELVEKSGLDIVVVLGPN